MTLPGLGHAGLVACVATVVLVGPCTPALAQTGVVKLDLVSAGFGPWGRWDSTDFRWGLSPGDLRAVELAVGLTASSGVGGALGFRAIDQAQPVAEHGFGNPLPLGGAVATVFWLRPVRPGSGTTATRAVYAAAELSSGNWLRTECGVSWTFRPLRLDIEAAWTNALDAGLHPPNTVCLALRLGVGGWYMLTLSGP